VVCYIEVPFKAGLTSYLKKKKCLKLSTWYSEAVNQRTDNIMAKNRTDKRTNNDLQDAIWKIKSNNTNPTKNRG
jgi:hypothetical protein